MVCFIPIKMIMLLSDWFPAVLLKAQSNFLLFDVVWHQLPKQRLGKKTQKNSNEKCDIFIILYNHMFYLQIISFRYWSTQVLLIVNSLVVG